MASAVPILSVAGLVIALPATAANWRKYADERPFFGTGWARKIMRRIDYTTSVIDSFGDDYCPEKLYWDRARLRRALAAGHEFGYDETESRALRLFWLPGVLLLCSAG
ncbi:Uncharacterised protein [Nocardia africana]|uniref:Uncharacterized protein n=2 Tax=Nocardiaceae TaxID=85025 RepID=A0A378X7E0_9NOCA|nr:Uncharacterised protein [Nocardia africana]